MLPSGVLLSGLTVLTVPISSTEAVVQVAKPVATTQSTSVADASALITMTLSFSPTQLVNLGMRPEALTRVHLDASGK